MLRRSTGRVREWRSRFDIQWYRRRADGVVVMVAGLVYGMLFGKAVYGVLLSSFAAFETHLALSCHLSLQMTIAFVDIKLPNNHLLYM